MANQFLDTFAKTAKQSVENPAPVITNQIDEAKMAMFFEAHPEIFDFAVEHQMRQDRAEARTQAPNEHARKMAQIMGLCMSLSSFGVWLQEEAKK